MSDDLFSTRMRAAFFGYKSKCFVVGLGRMKGAPPNVCQFRAHQRERERERGSWIDSNLLVRRWMTSLGILGRQQWMDSQISLWMITKLLLSGGFDALLEIITLRINGSVNHQQAWIKPWQRPAVTERPKQAAGPACRTVSPSGSSVYRWCTPEGYHHRTVVAHVTDTLKNSNTLYAAVTPPLNSF